MIGMSIGFGGCFPVGPTGGPPPPGGALSVSETQGTVEITTGSEALTVTITNSSMFDGVYVLDPAMLDLGPVSLVPPVVAFTDATNTELSVQSGLWLHSDGAGFGFQWQQDGVDLPDFTGTQISIQPGDAGTQFSVRQIATDVNGTRTEDSNQVSIAAGGFQDLFDDADGTLLADRPEYTPRESTTPARFEVRNSVAQSSHPSGSEVLEVNYGLAGDQWIEFEVAQVASNAAATMAFWLRRQPDGAGYFLWWTGSSLSIRGSYVTGGYSIAQFSYTVQVGDVIRYQVVGSTHQVLVNGSLLPESGTQGAYVSGPAAIGVAPTGRPTEADQKIAALRVGDV